MSSDPQIILPIGQDNPLDKQKYAINSRDGINVIKKYINYFRLNQFGGEDTTKRPKTIEEIIDGIIKNIRSLHDHCFDDNEQKQLAKEPIKKNAVEESGSVSQSVKEDLKTSLPDKEDPGYFELLMENIGF